MPSSAPTAGPSAAVSTFIPSVSSAVIATNVYEYFGSISLWVDPTFYWSVEPGQIITLTSWSCYGIQAIYLYSFDGTNYNTVFSGAFVAVSGNCPTLVQTVPTSYSHGYELYFGLNCLTSNGCSGYFELSLSSTLVLDYYYDLNPYLDGYYSSICPQLYYLTFYQISLCAGQYLTASSCNLFNDGTSSEIVVYDPTTATCYYAWSTCAVTAAVAGPSIGCVTLNVYQSCFNPNQYGNNYRCSGEGYVTYLI